MSTKQDQKSMIKIMIKGQGSPSDFGNKPQEALSASNDQLSDGDDLARSLSTSQSDPGTSTPLSRDSSTNNLLNFKVKANNSPVKEEKSQELPLEFPQNIRGNIKDQDWEKIMMKLEGCDSLSVLCGMLNVVDKDTISPDFKEFFSDVKFSNFFVVGNLWAQIRKVYYAPDLSSHSTSSQNIEVNVGRKSEKSGERKKEKEEKKRSRSSKNSDSQKSNSLTYKVVSSIEVLDIERK